MHPVAAKCSFPWKEFAQSSTSSEYVLVPSSRNPGVASFAPSGWSYSADLLARFELCGLSSIAISTPKSTKSIHGSFTCESSFSSTSNSLKDLKFFEVRVGLRFGSNHHQTEYHFPACTTSERKTPPTPPNIPPPALLAFTWNTTSTTPSTSFSSDDDNDDPLLPLLQPTLCHIDDKTMDFPTSTPRMLS